MREKILFTIICFVCLFIAFNDGQRNNIAIQLGFLTITLFSAYMINVDKEHPYSLHKIFFLFALFFYGIAAWWQYKNNATMFGVNSLNNYNYMQANIYIIIYLIVFSLVYYFFVPRIKYVEFKKYLFYYEWNNTTRIILLIISIIFCWLLWYNNGGNIYNLLFRGSDFNTKSVYDNKSISLLINTVVNVPLIIFLYYIYCGNKNKILGLFYLLLALFSSFPTSMPRLKVNKYLFII
jgi:hypothetical protein